MNILQKTIADSLAHNFPRTEPAREAPRCQYVKINGTRCGSPALHNRRLCYFHNRMRLPRPSGAPFPPLEDAPAVQYALMTVLQELRDKKIDHRTAGLLLYGLQTASFNLHRQRFAPFPSDCVLHDPGDLLSATPASRRSRRPAAADSRYPVPRLRKQRARGTSGKRNPRAYLRSGAVGAEDLDEVREFGEVAEGEMCGGGVEWLAGIKVKKPE